MAIQTNSRKTRNSRSTGRPTRGKAKANSTGTARPTASRHSRSAGTGPRSRRNATPLSQPVATVWRAAAATTHHAAARRKARKHAIRCQELLARIEGFLRSGLTSDRDFQAMVGRWVDHWDRHDWVLLRQHGAVGGAARPRPIGADGVTLARNALAYLVARRVLLGELERFLNTLP